MENNIAPLDNDTITRLVYAHDDELTEAIRQIRVLMDKVKELEEYIRAIVRECIAEGPEMKTRFTAEDIAQRFGWSPANARRVINNGSFGEVIAASPKHKVVTLQGVLEFERNRTVKALTHSKRETGRRTVIHKNPGRI